MPKLLQANGHTVYALKNAYHEKAFYASIEVDLWYENGAFSVAVKDQHQGTLFNMGGLTITAARSLWKAKIKALFGPVIRAVNRDKRYAVEREYNGHHDAYWITRFCGVYHGTSTTKEEALLKAATHRLRLSAV